MNTGLRTAGRLVGMLAAALLALQLFFLLRIALMTVVAPESTTFQRSEIWRLLVEKHELPWLQDSVPGNRIPLIPRHTIKVFADVDVTSAFSVDLDLVAASGSFARGNENNQHQSDGVYYLGPGNAPGDLRYRDAPVYRARLRQRDGIRRCGGGERGEDDGV